MIGHTIGTICLTLLTHTYDLAVVSVFMRSVSFGELVLGRFGWIAIHFLDVIGMNGILQHARM